jgi:hypothetical protein
MAPRPSLRKTTGLGIGRGSYRPHLAVISAPPSTLTAGSLIRQQSRKRTGTEAHWRCGVFLGRFGLGFTGASALGLFDQTQFTLALSFTFSGVWVGITNILVASSSAQCALMQILSLQRCCLNIPS